MSTRRACGLSIGGHDHVKCMGNHASQAKDFLSPGDVLVLATRSTAQSVPAQLPSEGSHKNTAHTHSAQSFVSSRNRFRLAAQKLHLTIHTQPWPCLVNSLYSVLSPSLPRVNMYQPTSPMLFSFGLDSHPPSPIVSSPR